MHEFFLVGSILDTHRELLLNRLKGLCDMSDSPPEKFHEHEMYFVLTNKGAPNISSITLVLRRALDHPDDPWHVRYLGDIVGVNDKSQHSLSRSYLDSSTSSQIKQFLNELGFVLDYEYILKGYLFRKGRLKITVSKLHKVPANAETVDMNTATETLTSSHLVELSLIATQSTNDIQDDIRNFAEQLKPLVNLEKIDKKLLQQHS